MALAAASHHLRTWKNPWIQATSQTSKSNLRVWKVREGRLDIKSRILVGEVEKSVFKWLSRLLEVPQESE